MSEVYQSLSHSKWDCQYPVVFVSLTYDLSGLIHTGSVRFRKPEPEQAGWTVELSPTYSGSEMERRMKRRDVLLKAMAQKITWWPAAEIIGVTDRSMRRWRERLEAEGYQGWADRRQGKPRFRRVPLATWEAGLR